MGKYAEGILEIIGHANLFAIGMLLIFYGAGRKLRLSSPRPYPSEHESHPEGRAITAHVSPREPWCAG